MRRYLELLRLPGILRITAFQLLARFPLGMLALAVLLHVQAGSGSYALAGAVAASMSVGQAAAVPLSSRAIGVFGARRTLLATAAVNGTAMLVLAFTPADPAPMLALGFLVGASVPPIMPAVRAFYPHLVPRRVLPALFALDTTAQELIWIGGPVVATLLTAVFSTAVPLVLGAAVTIIGTIFFVATPQLGTLHVEPSTARFGRVLLNRSLLLAVVTSAALMGSFTALELGVVARFEGSAILAGVAIATSCIGSLVGGIVLGHRRFRLRSLITALAIVALGTGLAGLVPGFVLLSLALFISGLGFAPALAALYFMVSTVVERRSATEAFGWLGTAALIGGATGTALGGVMSEEFGPPGAFAVATLLALAAVASPGIARLAGPIRGLVKQREEGASVDEAG